VYFRSIRIQFFSITAQTDARVSPLLQKYQDEIRPHPVQSYAIGYAVPQFDLTEGDRERERERERGRAGAAPR